MIEYPADYPNARPSVTFKTKVYHPLVRLETGELDLQVGFPTWVAGKQFTLNVLNFVKKIFMVQEYYKVEMSLNPEAAKKFTYSFPEFAAEVSKCVKESEADRFSNPEKSSLKFSKFDTVHKKILDNLINRKEETEAEKRAGFKSWFFNCFTELLSSSAINSHNI